MVSPAAAQSDATATPASPEAAASGSGLDEIVVTAERRSTRLQETPLSVAAFTGTDLTERNIRSTADLARLTPGLTSGGLVEGNRPTFTIRGIGQFSGRDAAERGVGLYVDDVYIPRTSASTLQLLDVERIEVLRGPQGTLFGRNSTGGAVRYITTKPTDTFEGRALIRIGSMDRRDVTALINIPFTDKLYGRFQAGKIQRDGFVKYTHPSANGDKGGDENDLVMRGVLRFVPTEDLDINLGVTRSVSNRGRNAQVVLFNNTTDAGTAATNAFLVGRGEAPLRINDPRVTSQGFYDNPAECYLYNNTYGFGSTSAANASVKNQRSFCDFYTRDRNTIGSLNVALKLSDALDLRAVTGLVNGSSNFNGGRDVSDFNSLSQELQLAYRGNGFGIVTGAFYFQEHPTRTTNGAALVTTAPDVGKCCTGAISQQEFRTKAIGLFAQANYYVTDQLQLIGGLRYSTERKKAIITNGSSPAAVPLNVALGVGPGYVFRNSDKWDNLNYRATVQYQATPAAMVYASVTTGFKAGGFNDSPLATPLAARPGRDNVGDRYIRAYDPEKVTSFESGVRTEWLDRRLRVNLTAFLMKYADVQITSPLIVQDGNATRTLNIVSNAGSVDLSGVEAEVVLRPMSGLTLNGSASYLHNHWKQVNQGSSILRADGACAAVAAAQRTLEQCGALDLPGGPKFQYAIGANYDLAVSAEREINLAANYSHSAKRNSYGSSVNIPVAAFGLLNLRAGYGPKDDSWKVALYASNALDKKYLVLAQNGVTQTGTNIAQPGPRREVGVELSARF